MYIHPTPRISFCLNDNTLTTTASKMTLPTNRAKITAASSSHIDSQKFNCTVALITISLITLAQVSAQLSNFDSIPSANGNEKFQSFRQSSTSGGEQRWSREISNKQQNEIYLANPKPLTTSSSMSSVDSYENQLPPVAQASTDPQQPTLPHPDLDNHINGGGQLNSLPSYQPTVYQTNSHLQASMNDDQANDRYNSHNDGNNTISNSIQTGKKSFSAQHGPNIHKLHKYLNERQQELVKANPGSLLAIARALKMAILECQYQMRQEPWDCPIHGFGVKPEDIFGKMMSRSFKETSFVHALISSALAHSVARACTESIITTCGRTQTRDGGYGENIDFGRQFAKQFMAATHDLPYTSLAGSSSMSRFARNLHNNGDSNLASQQHNQNHQSLVTSGSFVEPTRRERNIRNLINAHNDEVGRLVSNTQREHRQ